MLSEKQKQIQTLIENKLCGVDKDDALGRDNLSKKWVLDRNFRYNSHKC